MVADSLVTVSSGEIAPGFPSECSSFFSITTCPEFTGSAARVRMKNSSQLAQDLPRLSSESPASPAALSPRHLEMPGHLWQNWHWNVNSNWHTDSGWLVCKACAHSWRDRKFIPSPVLHPVDWRELTELCVQMKREVRTASKVSSAAGKDKGQALATQKTDMLDNLLGRLHPAAPPTGMQNAFSSP